MWKTKLKPDQSGQPTTIHVGPDVFLKITRRGEKVEVEISAPQNLKISRDGVIGRDTVGS